MQILVEFDRNIVNGTGAWSRQLGGLPSSDACFQVQLKKEMCSIVVYFSSLRPNHADMRQSTNHHLVLTMTCRLIGAKPLSEPLLEYC